MSHESATPGPPLDGPSSSDNADRYRAGTLQYTKPGLVMLFFWLLLGAFAFTLMRALIPLISYDAGMVPSILSLKLKELGASNKTIGLILGTTVYAMNFLVVPIAGFKSDRYRSRWGRRRPFLFFGTPLVSLLLVAIALAPEMGHWIHARFGNVSPALSIAAVVIVLIGVLTIVFQFFCMLVSAVYYWLFNDVVPERFVGRFTAIFQIACLVGSTTYNYFIFPHAEAHMREIFLGIALMFFCLFLLMCWQVKEGEYPPPPVTEKRGGPWASMKTYFRECFSHPFYLCNYGYSACLQVSGACLYVATLFYLYLGISLQQSGSLNACLGFLSAVMMYPIGALVDRWHPVRAMFLALLLFPLISLANFFVVASFHTLAVMMLIWLPVNVLYLASSLALMMRLLPKDRYGQFGSADAMVRSISSIGLSVAAGFFLDWLSRLYGGNEEYYRWMYIWAAGFQLAAFLFIWRVYRYWKHYGGDEHYAPPAVSPLSGETSS